ncbi:allene oxide synthase-lipoxygenase protein-like isoform X1 [Tachypleus tridentatus]|uniref:allene oxide synthase-lipoxygenase protein-like isoform X1 n=1 Tax=Tachypleus tridentatus TaxID=6853 RepID=UPI003FD35FC8
MGGAVARITGEHIVYVRTGDRKGAGTDANVFMILHDEEGTKTPAMKLNSFLRNDHERGDTGSYYFPKIEGFGRVSKIELWRDSFGLADDWFVDRVALEYRKEKKLKVYFPINRWIKPNKRYIFKLYDCSLPQEDEHQQQRSEELAEKKQLYEYTQNIEGGPVQIKAIPEGENFTDQYSWDIKSMSTKLKLDAKLIGLTSDKWESLQDLKNIFKLSLSEPSCLPRWNDDKWFAVQRVQGLNPISIQLCLEIPENFGVNVFELEPMLENLTLREALDAHRIFIVDLKVLKNLPCKDDRTICAPLALFFSTKQGTCTSCCPVISG